MKKTLLITLTILVLIFTATPGISLANETSVNVESLSDKTEGIEYASDSEYEMQAGGIVIFFGSIVVGWVIGAGIEYATGHSPQTWIKHGLYGMEAKILSFGPTMNPDHDIYVRSDGTIGSHCTTPPCRGYDSVEDK